MGNEKKAKKLCPPATVESDSVPAVVEKVAKESSKNEIDAIFGGKKRKKVAIVGSGEGEKSGAVAENEISDVKQVVSRTTTTTTTTKKEKKKKEKKKKTAGKSLELEKPSGPSLMSRKKTDDGLLVYNEEELGFNKEAGGTPLCPFDCDCCF